MNIFAIPLTERLAKHTAGVTFARQLSERREARRRPASAAVSTTTTTAARAGAAMMADRVPTRQVRQSPRLAELGASGATTETMPLTTNTNPQAGGDRVISRPT